MPPHWLCALYPVPLDYAHPGAGTIRLAVAKLPAADPARRRGSVFFNPGGPGVAGLPYARYWERYVGPSVHLVYDLVTWDPRAVILSKPALFCLSPEASAHARQTPAAVLTDPEIQMRLTATAAIAAGCAKNRFTSFVTTLDDVRDLDRLRQAVGDRKLSYVGISYGTVIGAVYANVFPNRYRALVLHAVVDSKTLFRSGFAFMTDDAVQLQKTLGAALQACDRAGPAPPPQPGPRRSDGFGCAFAPDAPQKYARLLAHVRELAFADGDSEPFTGLDYFSFLLVQPFTADYAADVLQRAYEAVVLGHRPGSPELAAAAHKPPPPPILADATGANSLDVNSATWCSDFGRIPGSWTAAAHRADRLAPVFGAAQVLTFSWCASWSAFGDRYTGGWDHGRAPILLFNQQWDYATPLAWAKAMTRRLGRAHLVTISGWGHGGATPCSTRAVDGYLLTGRPPSTSFCDDGTGLFRPVPPPTASIVTPADGATYAQGEVVHSSFTCTEGAGGSVIRSCLDQTGRPSGTAVDTATPGEHAFTVTAIAEDGLTASAGVTYTVSATPPPKPGPPTVAITTPMNGTTYTEGQVVHSSFTCAAGAGSAGIATCHDQNRQDSGAAIDTSTPGQHAFTVTATSADSPALTASASVTYSVSAVSPPGCPDPAAAYNQGFNAGFNSSFNPGFNSGFSSGFNTGFNHGFGPAHVARSASRFLARAQAVTGQALSAACDQVFNEGFNTGFNVGFNSGFNHGFNVGFNSGFNASFNGRHHG